MENGTSLYEDDSEGVPLRGKYSKDLFVVWTTFCRSRGPMTAETIANAIKELVKLKDYLQSNSGEGVKFVCIATNVPSQWIPDAERLVYDVEDMSDQVIQLLGGQPESRNSWASPRMKSVPDLGRTKSSKAVELGTIAEATGEEDESAVVSPMRQSDARSESNRSVERASELERPTLMSAKAETPELMIAKLQNREDSWISFRYALTSKWKKFQSVTNKRVSESIAWLNSEGGPDFTTFFVPEHESDVDALKEFKYSQIYDEVNRAIIEAHLRYQKNPAQFIAKNFGEDEDPVKPSVIACDVLYSGDYASSKLDSLKSVLDLVSAEQRKKRVPASLNFVPDA